ncbi:hypothetical protein I5373_02685 [Citrobacter koseri]|uniref:hypothetical protein n=1 Tax=Citrobacter koseri TaxID=545 RepID=UPI00190502DE|nr:hypothetical protein [Citrobacter koseri]MBJ8670240.1 hypothetical protein [Citrobacter koseri]
MTKAALAFVIMVFSLPALAKQTLTDDFVKEIETAINSTGEVSTSVDIDCPAKSASGKVLVTHVDYEYGKSKGVFVFKDTNDTPAEMTSIIPVYPDDDLDSETINGWDFVFKMPNGQFFITVMKNGKTKAGVNKNGTSGITEINCKASIPQ